MLRPFLLSLLFFAAALASVRAGEADAEPLNPERPVAPVPDAFAPLEQYKGKLTPEWIAALKTKDDPARLKIALEAVAELCPLSSGASVASQELLVILKTSNDPSIGRLAIVALGKMGADARDAESVLMTVLDNVIEAPASRAVACRALIQIAPASAFVRRAVVAAASDRNVEVRREAFDALIVLAMPASPFAPAPPTAPTGPVLPDIAAPPEDKSTDGQPANPKSTVAKPANSKLKANTVNDNGAFPYPPALETLAKAALSSRDAKEADAALRTIGDSGVDALLHALAAGSPLARAAAADALGSMKRAGRRAFPALVQAARKETDRRAREAQIFGAANLSVRDPAVLELLADSLGAKADPFAPFRWITADDLLYGVGKDALPALRKALRSDYSSSRLAALRILARFVAPTFLENVENPGDAKNRTLLLGLGLRDDAPKTQPALPVGVDDCLADIAGRLQDKDDGVRLFALATLNRIGPAAAGTLEAIQKASAERSAELKPDQKTGKSASMAFQRLAAIAVLNVSRNAAAPAYLTPFDGLTEVQLLAALANASPTERADAALALRLYSANAANADPLSKALDDPDAHIRRAAAQALGYFGAGAAGALPTLIKWLESEPKSRRAAIETLANLGANATDAAAPLARTVAEDAWPDDPEFPKTLVRALRPHAAVAVPALTGYIRSGSPEIRVRSAKALGLLGAAAAEALPALVELAQSADEAEAHAAYDALRLIGPEKDPEAIPFLAGVIRGELFASRRKWAVWALGQSRPALDAGIPECAGALAAALYDGDDSVCRAAYDALLEIGEPAVPILTATVSADRSARSYWPLCVLAALKADANLTVPRLFEFTLPGNPASRRAAAAERLGGYATMQTRHPGVAPALVRLLRTGDAASAHAAMRALKPLAAEVRPAVERLLFDRDPAVRKIAAETLDSF